MKTISSKKIPLSKIVYDDENPNKMTPAKKEALRKVMKKHGFAVDPWVNKRSDGRYDVIDGEHRLKILHEEGITHVNARIFSVDKTELRKMRQIANKLKGKHDKKKDLAELKAIFDSDQLSDYSTMSGDSIEELENILSKKHDIIRTKTETPKKALKKNQYNNGKAVAKIGQHYKLGDHRLIVGDCTDAETVRRLFGDNVATCLMTDPPYGVDVGEKAQFLDEQKGYEKQKRGIEHDVIIHDYVMFFSTFLKLIPFSRTNALYIWMSETRTCEVQKACKESDIKISQTLIWRKNNTVLSRLDYHPNHELILYGWLNDTTHAFHGPRGLPTVIEAAANRKNEWHPTQKPLQVVRNLISYSSKKGDIVYDPFCGGGTTLIACEQSGRVCYAVELDPKFADATITRWEQLTKKKAELIK